MCQLITIKQHQWDTVLATSEAAPETAATEAAEAEADSLKQEYRKGGSGFTGWCNHMVRFDQAKLMPSTVCLYYQTGWAHFEVSSTETAD